MNKRIEPASLAFLAALTLTGCIRGTSHEGTEGIALAPPPATIPPPDSSSPPAPAPVPPAPPPAPPAPPPPPPPAPTAPPVPPLSSTVVSLDDNHRVGINHWPDRDPTRGPRGEVVEGMECYPGLDPPTAYHVHSHLSIFLDGVALAIPEDVGIVKLTPTTQCVYSLHTHNHSGKLHVEGPAPARFTLGQFFTIWGHPLEPDNVAGLTGKPIVVYVTDNNGVVTQATGDWNEIELLSHREITIQVGTPIDEIPNYSWRNH